MNYLDGIPVTVKWKQPFVDWVNGLEDVGPPVTLDDPENQGVVYVLPERETDGESLLASFAGLIFQEELSVWEEDESTWPSDRSFKIFNDWFHVEMLDMVVDLTKEKPDIAEPKLFKSTGKMNKFINELTAGKHVEPGPPETPLAYAQELMYQAWEMDSPKKRIALAHKALEACPDCADACNVLAEDEAASLEERLDWYQNGVNSGERALGPETFKEAAGRFWGVLETRPYMRAKLGLARTLWSLKRYDESLAHYRQMLLLNTHDNQGVRYILLSCLGKLGRFDDIAEFMASSEYQEDGSTEWSYMEALVSFVKEGASPASLEKLRKAMTENIHVPDYLLGKKSLPSVLPESMTWHGEDEAIIVADAFLPSWKRAAGALEWMGHEFQNVYPKAGRNDLCLCGSGKKFKKCCLN